MTPGGCDRAVSEHRRMTGERKSAPQPSVWNTVAMPIVCAAIVLVSLIVGGSMHPPDSSKNYFQIGIQNIVEVVTRRTVP
jgi:hypothetical protein